MSSVGQMSREDEARRLLLPHGLGRELASLCYILSSAAIWAAEDPVQSAPCVSKAPESASEPGSGGSVRSFRGSQALSEQLE